MTYQKVRRFAMILALILAIGIFIACLVSVANFGITLIPTQPAVKSLPTAAHAHPPSGPDPFMGPVATPTP